MRSNCLVFALSRWIKNGGYIVVRKSHMGPFPHFIWCRDLRDAEIEHFQPIAPRQGVRAAFHKLWFDGVVKDTDLDTD